MWILLDLIIVAFVAIYVFISARRGFVKTAIEFVGFALSIYLAFTIGGGISNSIYEKTIEPAVVNTAVNAVGETAGDGVDDAVDSTWNSLPEYVTKLADNFDITPDTLRETIKDAAIGTNQVAPIAKQASASILKPIVVPLIQTAVGVIIFVVLMFLVKLLAKVINRLFNIPIVGGLNKTLGAVLGFGKGVLVAAVVVIVINTIVSFSVDGFLFFTAENIENSMIFKFLAGFSPIS